jgi:hypothetical protein
MIPSVEHSLPKKIQRKGFSDENKFLPHHVAASEFESSESKEESEMENANENDEFSVFHWSRMTSFFHYLFPRLFVNFSRFSRQSFTYSTNFLE